jgi:hypothetical protein
MAGISLNQMYKQSGAADSGVSYKDWMASEEKLYNSKIENGKIKGQMPFNFWMQARWQGKLNASGGGTPSPDNMMNATGIGATLTGIGKDILAKAVEKTGTGATPAPATYFPPEKRILGMKPVVFWSVTTVVGLTAIFVTVRVVRKMRKS